MSLLHTDSEHSFLDSDTPPEPDTGHDVRHRQDWTAVVADYNMIVTMDFQHRLEQQGFDRVLVCRSQKELVHFFNMNHEPDLVLLGDLQKINGSSFYRVKELFQDTSNSPDVSPNLPIVSIGLINVEHWNLPNPVMTLSKPLTETDFHNVMQFTRSNAENTSTA